MGVCQGLMALMPFTGHLCSCSFYGAQVLFSSSVMYGNFVTIAQRRAIAKEAQEHKDRSVAQQTIAAAGRCREQLHWHTVLRLLLAPAQSKSMLMRFQPMLDSTQFVVNHTKLQSQHGAFVCTLNVPNPAKLFASCQVSFLLCN